MITIHHSLYAFKCKNNGDEGGEIIFVDLLISQESHILDAIQNHTLRMIGSLLQSLCIECLKNEFVNLMTAYNVCVHVCVCVCITMQGGGQDPRAERGGRLVVRRACPNRGARVALPLLWPHKVAPAVPFPPLNFSIYFGDFPHRSFLKDLFVTCSFR